MKPLALPGLCLFMLLSPSVHATGTSTSYSTWTLSGRLVTLQFLLPASEAERLVGTDLPTLSVRELGDYVLQHAAVNSGAMDCPAIDQGYDLGKVDPLEVGSDQYGFEIFFQCPVAGAMVLRDEVLFDRVPGHVNFAHIQRQGQTVDQIFTSSDRQIPVAALGLPPPARLSKYVGLGGMHVLRSAVQIGFLVGAAMLVRRRRDAGIVIAALLLGYLSSLALSSGGLVLPRINFVEAFLGLLVAILGLTMARRQALQHNRALVMSWSGLLLLVALGATLQGAVLTALFLMGAAAFSGGFLVLSHWYDRRDVVWVALAVAFGFLDGFLLSSMLPGAHFSLPAAVRMQAGFDIGAVLAQALIFGAALVAIALLQRRKLAALRTLAADVAAAGLAGVGAFFLFVRIWS